MKTAGVIAEYNPFHNGHRYQLDKIRQETGADYIIVALSGDFLQRGVPALMDKYRRTEMALSQGADLVLELPAIFASASAEFFAAGGVNLLAATGVLDELCYGCETKQPEIMRQLVTLLSEESPAYREKLRLFLASGDSFPKARTAALGFLCNNFQADCSEEELKEFLSAPNNILALEYEKALAALPSNLSHQPVSHPILRVGGGYHSTEMTGTSFASATAIRNALETCEKVDDVRNKLEKALPSTVLSLLCDGFSGGVLTGENDFSAALYSRLLTCREQGYETFADCSRELSCKIQNNLDNFLSFTQFAGLLKSKEITYTRICRALTHILLGITREDLPSPAACVPRYLRVLGFRKSAASLLSAIKKEASVPLITKVSDASRILAADAYALLQKDIHCADLYRGIVSIRSQKLLPDEFTQRLVIIP